MMRSKHLIVITILVVVMMLLSACGEKETKTTVDEAKPAETTVVLETTSEGGTVEQDSEGNKITKDSEGKVTKVEDKDGNPVDVNEYLSTHTWVENPSSKKPDLDSSSNSSASDNSNPSNKSSSSAKTGNPSSNGSGSPENNGGQNSTNSQDDEEGEIPVVIATLPDDDDMIELPD